MITAKVHPKFTAIYVLATAFVLGDIPTAEAGCWVSETNCKLSTSLSGLDIDVFDATGDSMRKSARAQMRLGYTVSTRGRIQKKVAIAQSAFVMRKGSEGEIGDIALGLGDGGSFTMDLRENFVKIQYIWDF